MVMFAGTILTRQLKEVSLGPRLLGVPGSGTNNNGTEGYRLLSRALITLTNYVQPIFAPYFLADARRPP